MKFNSIKSALAGAAVLAVSLGATAAQAATNQATATATAKIISAITVTKNTDLNFGTAIASAAGGTVVVTPLVAATQTCTGVTCTGGGQTSAQFSISGATGTVAVITVPASVSLTGPGVAMTATLNSSAATLALLGTAADAFQVGGSLAVGANQATGSYSGSFTVTVAYQ
jgi:hypothetical protein